MIIRGNLEQSCSFCGKPESQVFTLVKGPSVYICNECVQLCVDIIKDKVKATTDQEAP